ncbi:MAG: hypothetical protein WCK21_01880 [Actinomycetota bacterium]
MGIERNSTASDVAAIGAAAITRVTSARPASSTTTSASDGPVRPSVRKAITTTGSDPGVAIMVGEPTTTTEVMPSEPPMVSSANGERTNSS